jgi:hypothetical protein
LWHAMLTSCWWMGFGRWSVSVLQIQSIALALKRHHTTQWFYRFVDKFQGCGLAVFWV